MVCSPTTDLLLCMFLCPKSTPTPQAHVVGYRVNFSGCNALIQPNSASVLCPKHQILVLPCGLVSEWILYLSPSIMGYFPGRIGSPFNLTPHTKWYFYLPKEFLQFFEQNYDMLFVKEMCYPFREIKFANTISNQDR